MLKNSLLGQQKPVIGGADHIAIDGQCQFEERIQENWHLLKTKMRDRASLHSAPLLTATSGATLIADYGANVTGRDGSLAIALAGE